MILEAVYAAVVILCAGAIILYATFFLFKRLKKGDKKVTSFLDWIKHILEAILGL